MKYILMLFLAFGLLPVYAQDNTELVEQSNELYTKIYSENNLDKKIQIFNEPESKALYKRFPNGQAMAAFTIAEQYIKNGDKKNSVLWMNQTKAIRQINESLLRDFYETFQRLGEHQFILDNVSKEMDSLYKKLENHTDAQGTALNLYSARLPYYMESKMALKLYDEACKKMDMVYAYCGNTFLNAQSYFQYADALLATGKGDQAITVFARYAAEKINFSPKVLEKQKLLISKVPNGAAKFETALAAAASHQQSIYKQLIGSLNEINGLDLKEKLGKSKYVLLSFWGTWCQPCTESHPKLIALYNQYKDHGLEVLGIAQENGSDIGKMESGLRASVEKQGLPWLQTMLPPNRERTHPVNKFLISGYPTKILVDREGKVLGRFVSASLENMNNLKQLLEEGLGNEESKARQIKIKSARNAYDVFAKTGPLAQKEKLYKAFIADEGVTVTEVSAIQDQMLQDMSIAYAKSKNTAVAKQYYQQIKGEAIKCNAVLELVKYMNTNAEKAAIIEAQFSRLIAKDILGSVLQPHIHKYSRLAKQYVKFLPKTGAEDLTLKYLEPLYQSTAKCFLADLHSNKGAVNIDLENTLTYAYAKAFAKKGKYEEVAKVLASYLNADSNYTTVRSKMLLDFKDVPNLSALFDKFKPTGDEIFFQLVGQIVLKEDINGKLLESKAIDNKFFLVDFWGSWCMPCRMGNPHLKELYAKYKDSGFEIIGLASEGGNIETKMKNWKSAVYQDQLPWPQLINDDREGSGFDPVKAFQVNSFPTKMLFDQNRKLIGTYKGGDDDQLDAKLKEIFGK